MNYITITALDRYLGSEVLSIGQVVTLEKEPTNRYDAEAIKVLANKTKVGYVANSVYSVVRGTHSAGFIFREFEEKTCATIRFIHDGIAIAELS
ncbi:MAG: hypothetical protein HUJ57_07925 [Erysipelotrichaceae bacterium]|nr:hypothetical protein [Erysipelotrichaceae bacterium]